MSMKYIRTKDGVYEEYAREKRPNGGVIATNTVLIPYSAILREADTIEELCDEIVVIYPDGSKCCFDAQSYYNAKNFRDVYDIDFEREDIYFAIWTKWGLKYVAKIDDNGELELI